MSEPASARNTWRWKSREEAYIQFLPVLMLILIGLYGKAAAKVYYQFGLDNAYDFGASTQRLSIKSSIWKLKGDYRPGATLDGESLSGYGVIFGGDMDVDPDILSIQLGKVLYSNSSSQRWFPLLGVVTGGSIGVLLSNQIGASLSIWNYLGLFSGISLESRYLTKDKGSLRVAIFHRFGIPLDLLLIR